MLKHIKQATVLGDFARPLTESPLPGNFVNLGTSERGGRMKITICIGFKRNIAESGNILHTYWTIRKFTFNLFVLILVDLQEVVDLDTRREKKRTNQFSGRYQTTPVLFSVMFSFCIIKKLGMVPNATRKKLGSLLHDLNEHFLLKLWMAVHSGRISSACRSLTCLRNSLSCWPAAGLRATAPSSLLAGASAGAVDLRRHTVLFPPLPSPHISIPWPGCQDTATPWTMHHAITELPVYLRLGDRWDLRERWLGSSEGHEWARHERTILNLASWDPDYASTPSQDVLPSSGGRLALDMNHEWARYQTTKQNPAVWMWPEILIVLRFRSLCFQKANILTAGRCVEWTPASGWSHSDPSFSPWWRLQVDGAEIVYC